MCVPSCHVPLNAIDVFGPRQSGQGTVDACHEDAGE